MRIIKAALIFYFIFVSGIAYALPTAKVTIKVIEQSGEPVEDASVSVYYKLDINHSNTDSGLTDGDGFFEASGSTLRYVGGCNITKVGYYPSGCNYSERNLKKITGITGFRRWEPWNPTITVVLKKIKEPIALYMRDVGSKSIYKGIEEDPSSFLTVIDKFIGFDLVASDWVVPYGLGTHRDFLFKLEKRYLDPDDFKHVLTLKFSNPGDGMQPYYTEKNNASIFKMPYHAPGNSYKNKLVQLYENIPDTIDKKYFRQDQNYFFRVRTKLDEKGNVVSALYGKIEGNIKFPSGTERPLARLRFKYYLNPTPNDTNLEYDSEKNLFGSKFSRKR